MYKDHIKKNLSIEPIGNGNIYRTVSYDVIAKQTFKLTNKTKDTLGTYSLKVKGEFKGIKTEPTYLLECDSLLPEKTITEKVIFRDNFFRMLLGYQRDNIWIKSNIEIASFPTNGDGPDYDSIMALKPHSFLESYAMPIKIGVHKLLY